MANERADLVLAVQAGTPIQSITALLAGQGQFVPFDAPLPQLQRSAACSPPAGWVPADTLRSYPRFLLGSTIVLADGTIASAGGMVVKNVAGYDMSRLYVGSFGTLGVLTRANLKSFPSPQYARLFLASLPEHTRERAWRSSPVCTSPRQRLFASMDFTMLSMARRARGTDSGVVGRHEAQLERATLELRSALGRAGVPETRIVEAGAREAFQRVVDAYVACLGERSVTYRLNSVAQETGSCALSLQHLARRFELCSETIADVMNGDVVLRVSDFDPHAFGAKIEFFDEALHEVQPRAQVIASEHSRRAYLRVWGTPPAAIDRMRALKQRFDPNRTLNPGCFVDGI